MRLCKRDSFYFLSLLLLCHSSIHGLLIPEEEKPRSINQKLDPLINFAKKKFSELIYSDFREEQLKKKEKEYEKRFSTWSYTRSLKYLKKNEEFQKSFYNKSSSSDQSQKKKSNTKKHHPEETIYKRYALNPDSLLKGFPRYISEDFNEAVKKRSSKRNFDDPILSEMYQNDTKSFFTEDDFQESYHFNMYPKNINLNHNIVKVSIPYKNRKDQRIRRFLIRGDELSTRESLKDAKAFPLIDYDYENYLKMRKQKSRYLKPKSKNNTATEESTTTTSSHSKRSITSTSNTSDKDEMATVDYSEDKSFVFYYFCDDDDAKCEKALKVFEHAGERIIKLIDFKYSLYVYIYYYSFCNHNPNCHSTVMGSAAPTFFYTVNKTADSDNNGAIPENPIFTNNDDLIDAWRDTTDPAAQDAVIKERKASSNYKRNASKNKEKINNKRKMKERNQKDASSSLNSDDYDTSSNMTAIFINPFLGYKNSESLINQHYSPVNVSGIHSNNNQFEADKEENIEDEQEEDGEDKKNESSEPVLDFNTREQEEIKVDINNESLDSDYSYPSALIKQLTGIETESDILVLFNSDFEWDYDESERGKKYNLEQTVLHEFLHGLGFLSSWYNWFNVDDTILIPADITLSTSGDYGIMEKPYIFNKYIVNHVEQQWVSNYQKKIVEDFKHFPEFPFKSQLYRHFKESASYDVAKKVHKIMTTPEAVTFWCVAPYNLSSSMQRSESLVPPTLKKIKHKKRFKMAKTSKIKSSTTSKEPEKTGFHSGDYYDHYQEYLNEIDDYDKNYGNEDMMAEDEKEEEEEIIIKQSKLYRNWLVLYTPPTFYTGTSLSHFDSSRYRKTKNYIMRPYMDSSTSISYSEEEYNNHQGISDDILCVLRTLGYTLNSDEGK